MLFGRARAEVRRTSWHPSRACGGGIDAQMRSPLMRPPAALGRENEGVEWDAVGSEPHIVASAALDCARMY